MERRRIEIHNLEDLAETIRTALFDEEEEERVKVPIGKISQSLQAKYENWKHDNEDFIDEVRYKKEQLEKRGLRELDELFKSRFEEIAKRKESLWSSIRTELNLTDEQSLNLDPKTGMISEWKDADEIMGD
jgi:hypothetical protein